MPNVTGTLKGAGRVTATVRSVSGVSGVSGILKSASTTTAKAEDKSNVTATTAAAESNITGTARSTMGGTYNHNLLLNRDAPDQHPMSSITGLPLALEELRSKIGGMAFDGGYVDTEGYMHLTLGGEDVAGFEPFFVGFGGGGGGTGGSENNAEMKLTNTSGWLYKYIAEGNTCSVEFEWSSIEDGISTGKGTMKVSVGGSVKSTTSVTQGPISLDVTSYLSSGENTIKINISDAYGNSRSLNYTINVMSLRLSTTFDDKAQYTGAVNYYYTPTGAITKTVHFLLDGKEIGTETVNVTGQQQNFIIPAQPHGSHTLEVYFTAEVDGETVTSNALYHDLICMEEGNMTPIIASSYKPVATEQFVSFNVPHIVIDPANLATSVAYRVNGKVMSELTVDRTEQPWSCRGDEVGDLLLEIVCGDTVKSFTVPIYESTIKVSAVTNNLAMHLGTMGRSNNEANPQIWESNGISADLQNFNFVSDGWQRDEDGNTVLRVANDARVHIPLKIFAEDFRTTGKTIEIEFASRDVLNYDAILFDCMSGGRGLEVTAQKATLVSEQSTVGTQYKEEEHIRLSFVVEKKAANKLLLIYINGVMSGAVNYPDDDDFSQHDPVGITIGSNDCTTDIYNIRVYDSDLTRYQILDNWIADTASGAERKARYERNKNYDDYGQITIETLKKDCPYLVLECPALPQFKGDKKTCSGYYVDPVHPERSFRFENAQIDVQGTSSQYYYVKNFKIKFKGGFILWNGQTATVYAMNDDAVPVDTFTFKADVASSEGANNVILAKLYNDLCPTKTPPQEADPRVRQTIDGHPCVIFWDSGSGPKFIGKYNFNNDKGTEDTFGFADGDESWEILQNGTERTGFRSNDFSEGSGWENDFEARYPEDNKDTTNLAAFIGWVASTNADAATNAALPASVTYDGVTYAADTPAYRLAKFRAELEDWADVADLVFYYVFTEIFLAIDQREKNAFPTLFLAMALWIMFFYDADSTLGIDNKGRLAFEYFLEDIDYTESGDPVYNGQNSVLWVNLRKCFYAEIEAEYQRLRTTMRDDGSKQPLISYDVVNGLYEAHQAVWSEAIFNEDMYRKCLEDYILNGNTQYLSMLLGMKEQQRKWWLFNRFRYLDSKYCTGDAMENRIIIRAHAQANIKLIAYVNMYGQVFFNAERVEHRMFRGQEYEFVWAASGAEDPVIGINSADMLTSLGDLSGLMVQTINIAKAIHLTYLKVGDAAADYINDNLTEVTLGNNYLLRYVDFRNCVSLAQPVDASGCTGLEEVYFDGAKITGLSLPNGGKTKILHLPDTMTNLTLLNQQALTEFVMPGFSNVSTLRIENCSSVINTAEAVAQMKSTGRVRLVGINWTLNTLDVVEKLLGMGGLTESGDNTAKAVLSGTVHFTCALPISKLVEYEKAFPYATFTADTYDIDVLVAAPYAVVMDSMGAMIRMSDGGHQSQYTAAEIDEFVAAVQEQMAAIDSSE